FFLRQFHYDKTPLAAEVIADRPSPLGRWQTIQFPAAYGGERMVVHLFLPPRGRPPYQTVVVFPGSQALHTKTFDPADLKRADFIVKSGRAVMLPIYKGTYERSDEMKSDFPEETSLYKDHVI